MEAVERVAHQAGAFGRLDIPVGQRNVEVLVDRQVVDQVIALEHEADVLLVQLHAVLGLHLVNGMIQKIELAGPRAVQHADDAEQRRFAGARGTHDSDKLAFLDVHFDAPQDVGAAVARFVEFVQIRGSDHVILFYLTNGEWMGPGYSLAAKTGGRFGTVAAATSTVTAMAAVWSTSTRSTHKCNAVPSAADWNVPAGTGLPPLGMTHIS